MSPSASNHPSHRTLEHSIVCASVQLLGGFAPSSPRRTSTLLHDIWINTGQAVIDDIAQRLTALSLGDPPSPSATEETLRATANGKAMGPDELPTELFKGPPGRFCTASIASSLLDIWRGIHTPLATSSATFGLTPLTSSQDIFSILCRLRIALRLSMALCWMHNTIGGAHQVQKYVAHLREQQSIRIFTLH